MYIFCKYNKKDLVNRSPLSSHYPQTKELNSAEIFSFISLITIFEVIVN